MLQAIQILAYIHLYSPNLIVLDEPDSHLHPNNQRAICSVLSEMAVERGIQVIMTTHSRHVLDATVGSAKVVWMQKGVAKEATADDAVDVLLDMGALDVKETLAAQSPDILVVTEDSIKKPLEVVVEANNSKKRKIVVNSYFGVKATDNTKSLIHAVRKFSQAKIIVHRDRDYMTPLEVEEWKKEIRSVGAVPFVTKGTDVELYFTSVAHLKAVNPALSEPQLTDWRSKAVNARLPDMKEKAINWRLDFERRGKTGSGNPGKIAGEIDKLFKGPEAEWLHGKELIAGIRQAAAAETGNNIAVYVASPALEDDELKKAIAGA